MIELVRGNLLTADAEALVNTANTVGYMGKGIALQFKQAFPANFAAYAKACSRGEVAIGRMFVFDTGNLVNPRYIVNFSTKRHWRNKSMLSDIEAGLIALVEEVRTRQIRSIAIPPLGCGLGGPCSICLHSRGSRSPAGLQAPAAPSSCSAVAQPTSCHTPTSPCSALHMRRRRFCWLSTISRNSGGTGGRQS
jgi:O-acetyl-ADP-ribose deacetylase (regulator of RNase III)